MGVTWIMAAVVALLAPDAGAPAAGAAGAPASATPASATPASATPAPPPPPPPAKGPPPEVSLSCAPTPIMMGQPLVCTLEAVAPEDVRVEVPIPEEAGAVRVAGGAKVDKAARSEALEGGKRKWVRRFALTTLKPRDIVVPDLTLTWHEADGAVGVVDVPGQRVPVKLISAGQVDPRFHTLAEPLGKALSEEPDEGDVSAVAAFWESHGPAPYLVTNWPLLIAFIALLAGAMGYGVAWAVRRWREANPVGEAPWVDPRPAHVIALADLQALEVEDLPGQGEVKLYYSRLSEIIRLYLERRFGFYALEMTSDEIRAHLPGLDLSGQGHQAMEDFLAETDLVKFAGFAPSDSAVETVMRAARGIIELTRAPDVEAAEPPAGVAAEGGAA